jgi:hypothetical protein
MSLQHGIYALSSRSKHVVEALDIGLLDIDGFPKEAVSVIKRACLG